MLNTVYQLVAPRKFEVTYENIGLQDDDIIVRPTHLSICNADQRYYQGLREEHVLRQKLPMALIHEGIGVVLRDPSGEFEPGEEVVMIPNTPVEEDEFIAENYLRSSKFRASGFIGFMQENPQGQISPSATGNQQRSSGIYGNCQCQCSCDFTL
mgnify:CR=1 FL=1